ncbi:MAG: hypothetical protein OXE76_04680 [Alphaproteobacteria bacterium]|nr:hypothetical protein [Alphaproteobacteria bacterium]
MTGWRDFLRGRRSGRSVQLEKTPYEGKAEEDATGGPKRIGLSPCNGNGERAEESDKRHDDLDKDENENDALRGHEFEEFGWEPLHCSHSLFVSACAAIMLLIADLAEPEHMRPWQVLGGLGCYIAGVVLFFALERRIHRRKRAHPVPDRTGGGRYALVFMAAAFCFNSGGATEGLAGWIAMSALALGCAADGAWLALVAGRRGVGFFVAFRDVSCGERAEQERYWTARFGRDGR